MEFTIRILVVIVLIIIVFVVFLALLSGWFGDAGAGVKALQDWFSQLLKGGFKPAEGTSIPGIGNK
jgi:hypothetical protein